MIKFEDVKHQSTDKYFNNNQFSIDAFNKKYSLDGKETYVQAIKRVCDYVASVESTAELRKYWSERWFDEIYNDWWHPAGSIMQGAGCGRKISLTNCTTTSLGNTKPNEHWDNLESIFRNGAYKIAKYAAYRQGQGMDFSRLRPAKSKVFNSSNESTGSISWMQFIDSIAYYVGQKGRIPALLFSLICTHPDIIEFIKVKGDTTKIQNANISVQCTNSLYEAAEKDADWELVFEIPEVKIGDKIYVDVDSADADCQYDKNTNNWFYYAKHNRPYEKISKTVKAREILELIAKGMCSYGEPGIQNIDIARKYSNSDYVYDPLAKYDSRISGTNACSEQYLSPDSCCILLSINAEKFSTNPEEYEKQLAIIGPSVNRFADNVNECEIVYHTYATPGQRLAIESLRRTGCGMTSIAGWLFRANNEYGSESGNKAIEHFSERYNYYLYKSSIEIGKEKGNFKLFNREKFEQSPFVQRMIKLGLEFSHMRNCTCSSIAPTGTLSLMFRNTLFGYGVEPAFYMYFWKRTRIAGKYEYYFCVPSVVRETFASHGVSIPIDSDTIKDTWDGSRGKPIAQFIEINKDKLGIKFKNATEVDPLKKLDLMSRLMKSVDSSISVTYLLPENASWKDIYNFILEAYKKEVKSVAAFPDRKMYGIVSFVPFKELATKLIGEKIDIHSQNFSDEESSYIKTLANYTSTEHIVKTTAPKRPKELDCDIFHFKISKQLDKRRDFEYAVLVGVLGGEPYEVFAYENGQLDKKYKTGKIVKSKAGVYSLQLEDGSCVKDITKTTSEAEDALTRLISTALRHGADVSFVVSQLEKTEGDLYSFTKAIARALKKYIKNDTKQSGTCPNCGGGLIRQEGCVSCANNCGYSKCG